MRILLIEDDRRLCEVLQFQLERDGFITDCCYDGESGCETALHGSYALILLDRMLPHMDGLAVLDALRHAGVQTPVILLTALGEIADRVAGLNHGADDYIVKPFAYEELLARIRTVCRRPVRLENPDVCTYGDLHYDCSAKKLTCGSLILSLSKREGELLELFLKNPEQTLPRDLILTRVWGPYAEIEDGNLDNYIHFLRRRLRTLQSSVQITTIRGIGYCLERKA